MCFGFPLSKLSRDKWSFCSEKQQRISSSSKVGPVCVCVFVGACAVSAVAKAYMVHQFFSVLNIW